MKIEIKHLEDAFVKMNIEIGQMPSIIQLKKVKKFYTEGFHDKTSLWEWKAGAYNF